MNRDIADHRQEYSLDSIDIESVDPCPFLQFEQWLADANRGGLLEPNSMVLSTVDGEGRPAQRNVLLKYFDTNGFVFFTGYASRKAGHIAHNKNVSLLFSWLKLQRQVEISGIARKTSLTQSIKYFASRPRGSQLGAWVSNQSSVISSRTVLKKGLASLTNRFQGQDIPKPEGWGGFSVAPIRFEFWQGGKNRLHDRIEYITANDPADGWIRQRLAP